MRSGKWAGWLVCAGAEGFRGKPTNQRGSRTWVVGSGKLGGASAEPRDPGLVRRRAGRRTPCARESCDAPSSPEPSAGLFGGGRVGRVRGSVRAGRRTPCAERAVMAHSSPEPAAAGSEGTIACWVARVRSLAIPGWFGGGLVGALRARGRGDPSRSPEPLAAGSGGGDCLLGGASTEPRDPGLVRRGLAGALRAQREL